MHFISKKEKKLALLIDPEKFKLEDYRNNHEKISQEFNLFLVGGSTDRNSELDSSIAKLKTIFDLPIYIFPGSHNQISSKADGILFLSLISGDNPKYLIGEQRKTARKIKDSGIEVIPTGYILIDGEKETSVQLVSKTQPIAQENLDLILDTAVAGELLGMKAIYLEAGSGANKVVAPKIINQVSKECQALLIVGGGIRTRKEVNLAFENGADIVVIGTFIEENINNIKQL